MDSFREIHSKHFVGLLCQILYDMSLDTSSIPLFRVPNILCEYVHVSIVGVGAHHTHHVLYFHVTNVFIVM